MKVSSSSFLTKILIDGVSEPEFKQVLEFGTFLRCLQFMLPASNTRSRASHDQRCLYIVYANMTDTDWIFLAACEEFGVNPKITLIIVGKRHHIQYVVEEDNSWICH